MRISDWSSDVCSSDHFTAPLISATHHMFNAAMLDKVKPGVRIVNIGRGPVIDEQVLASGLAAGIIHSVALDVFEVEPLPADSPLRRYDLNIFGSPNRSNHQVSVRLVRLNAHDLMSGFLHT